MKEQKISKTIYLTPAQMAKVEKVTKQIEKESKISLSFNKTIIRIIEQNA